MAEATTQINVTPKQLGKHLRSIRRKKGLSLSEVARGAGLSRRELVAYERGKVPIPESDLWVLAGSCGVDVAELVPSTPSRELTEAASSTSVGDTVSQLRRGQEDAGVAQYLPTLQKLQALAPGKRIPVKERELEEIATALGSTPRSIELKLQELLNCTPEEAERLRAMILVTPGGRGRPRALAAAPRALEAPAAPLPAPAASPVAEVPTPAPFAAAAATPVAPVTPLEATTEATAAAPPEPVQCIPVAPAAFLDQPLDAPLDGLHGNVDVFEELARLPEPVPLGDPSAPVPDLLAPQPFDGPLVGVPAIGPPEGAVELVDSTMPTTAAVAGSATWNAADAPPIDVAMRQGSSTWDLGEPPLVAKSSPTTEPTWETGDWQPPAPEGGDAAPAGFWEGTDDWVPPADAPADPPTDGPAEPPAWTTTTEIIDTPVDDDAPASGSTELGEATWAGSSWDAEPWSPPEPAVPSGAAADINPWLTDEWPREPADRGAWAHQPDQAAVETGFYVDWGTPETEAPPAWDLFAEPTAATPTEVEEPVADADDAPSWDSWSTPTDGDEPEPAADYNLFETVPSFEPVLTDEPAGIDEADEPDELLEPAGAVEVLEVVGAFEPDTVEAETYQPETYQPETYQPETYQPETVDAEVSEPETWETWAQPATSSESSPFVASADGTVELTPISWRAEADEVVEAAEEAEEASDPAGDPADAIAARDVAPVDEWVVDDEPHGTESTPEPAVATETPTVAEEFVTAGPDWQLGNALPLVEVQSQGGLVMRRADERWALADVTTTPDFVAEVEVDFRSGPGLGVLFRASIDDEGRMSGYSFDVDPIYDGGGYLVRQWQADRELWNPIARVSGDDPSSMYGTLLVRIEVTGEHLSAQVNGVEVLTVENLKQASADRGRDGATGDRVGVQAWSSSDLVIDTVRVASR